MITYFTVFGSKRPERVDRPAVVHFLDSPGFTTKIVIKSSGFFIFHDR